MFDALENRLLSRSLLVFLVRRYVTPPLTQLAIVGIHLNFLLLRASIPY